MSSMTERVDKLFAKWDRPDSPGCVLAVIRDGGFIHARGYGMADLERGIPITPSSVFDIGSTGKQFTAAVIVILAARGLLAVDDSLRKVLPEMPAYADRITIRHLLNHTSGLRDYLTLMELRGMSDVNLYAEDFLFDLIVHQKGLNFPPGSQYTYCNSGYFLLGTIAQRVSGRHLTELIRELILEPLGMKHTTFNKDFRAIVKDRALSYHPGERQGTFVNALALSGGFGDGAILTCVEDLLLWDRNFYSNKLNQAQADLIAQLHQNGKLNNGKSIAYAFGLFVGTYKGQRVVQHGGGWAGYRTEMMRFPGQKFTAICLSNLGNVDPTMLCRQVADLYLEYEFSPGQSQARRTARQGAPPGEFGEFTGIYQNKQATLEISIKDGVLHVSSGVSEHPLRPIGTGKFQVEEHPIFLSFSGKQNERLALDEDGENILKYSRIRQAAYVPDAWDMYTGEYINSELDVRYSLTMKDGALQLQRTPFDDPQPLRLFTETVLACKTGEIRLQVADGSVKGFVLKTGRVTDIRFRKVFRARPQGEPAP